MTARRTRRCHNRGPPRSVKAVPGRRRKDHQDERGLIPTPIGHPLEPCGLEVTQPAATWNRAYGCQKSNRFTSLRSSALRRHQSKKARCWRRGNAGSATGLKSVCTDVRILSLPRHAEILTAQRREAYNTVSARAREFQDYFKRPFPAEDLVLHGLRTPGIHRHRGWFSCRTFRRI